MSVVPSDPATSALSYEQQYRDASPALAASLDIPYLDMFGKIGSYSSDRYSDSLHPNARGHADMARFVAAALQALSEEHWPGRRRLSIAAGGVHGLGAPPAGEDAHGPDSATAVQAQHPLLISQNELTPAKGRSCDAE